MDRTFNYTLSEEEYISFLSYQISSSKTMRGYRWFMMTSVPAVLLTGAFLLKLNSWLEISCIILLGVVWVLYGAKALWKSYIRRKIKKQFLPKLNLKGFSGLSCHFSDRGIEYREDKKKNNISYSDIMAMLPLDREFVFCYKGGAFLLPYRVFEGDDDIKQFVKDYEMCTAV